MRFQDTKFSKIGRFSIGIDNQTGKFYISIPVRNNYVEFEEYYEISADEFKIFSNNLQQAEVLAEKCRDRQEEQRLFYQPSKERGWPV